MQMSGSAAARSDRMVSSMGDMEPV
jgi:hypothetical protein